MVIDSFFVDKDVLVTGGAGFIGSHLVDELVDRGSNVTVLDDFSSSSKQNLEKSIHRIKIIKGDVRDKETVYSLVRDVDLVFHLAANASVPKSVKEPRLDYEKNSSGTFNVLDACRRHDVDGVVYSSSAAVYGKPQYIPMDEEHPTEPVSPYGASNLSGEKIGQAFSNTYGLPFTSLRIFNVYGPRQDKYVMYDFYRKLRQNPNELEVLGSGEQVRSFCYIKDAVKAFVLATKKGHGDVFNLSGDNQIKIKELVKKMIDKMNCQTKIKYTNQSWKGDIKKLVPDNSKIKEELGFEAKTNLSDGLDNLISWLNKQNKNQD